MQIEIGQIIRYRENGTDLKLKIIKKGYPFRESLRGKVIKTNKTSWEIGEEINFAFDSRTMRVIAPIEIKNLSTKTPDGKQIKCLIKKKD